MIAGVGNGNMNKSSVDAAARAVKKGVVVVRSSRVPTGMVGRNVELDDDKLGFIASDELMLGRRFPNVFVVSWLG